MINSRDDIILGSERLKKNGSGYGLALIGMYNMDDSEIQPLLVLSFILVVTFHF